MTLNGKSPTRMPVSHFDNIDSLNRKQSLPKKRVSRSRVFANFTKDTAPCLHLWAIFLLCALLKNLKKKEKEIIRSFKIITISNVIRTKLKFKFYNNLSKGKKRGKFLEFSFSLFIYQFIKLDLSREIIGKTNSFDYSRTSTRNVDTKESIPAPLQWRLLQRFQLLPMMCWLRKRTTHRFGSQLISILVIEFTWDIIQC